MRILHVIPCLAPRFGGPSAVVPEMASAVAKRGHHVEVFTTDIDGSARLPVPTGRAIEWRGVPTTFFRGLWAGRHAPSLSLNAALRDYVAEYDVVHIHSLYFLHTLVAGHQCRRLGVPYILCPHGALDPFHRSRRRWRKAVYSALIERRNINAAAGIHYGTVVEQQCAQSLGLRAPAFVIPLGVDASAFNNPNKPDDLLLAYPRLAGRTLVTFIGRLTEKKRLDLLIDAFAAMADTHSSTHLVIAGPDDEGLGRQLRERIRRLGLGEHVSLLGMVTGDTKTALLCQSHVFVLPSEDESFGVAVVEAMAAGVPVVVTKGVALHHDITKAAAGLVVPSIDTALASALRRLIGDRTLRMSMGKNGQALVHSTFGWSQIAVDLENMYNQAIKRQQVEASE